MLEAWFQAIVSLDCRGAHVACFPIVTALDATRYNLLLYKPPMSLICGAFVN